MNSANGIPFEWMLAIFRDDIAVDETTFRFTSDPPDEERFLGCLPGGPLPDTPYWAGYCDLPEGFCTATARELFDAPYYSGKSLKQRWGEVEVLTIGQIPVEDYLSWHQDDYPLDAYR